MDVKKIKEAMRRARAIVADYDRTITNPDLTPSRKALNSIRRAKDRLKLLFILASGRPLSYFTNYGEIVNVCDAIVAENGAVIFLPKRNEKKVFGLEASSSIKELIARLNVPADFFEVIASIPRAYESVVANALKESGLPATMEYNVDSIMVLPRGVSKLNGVLEALRMLEGDEGDFIAFGDGENDVDVMRKASIAIAVANASPQVKEVAHYVTSKPYGDGVAELLDVVMNG